MWWREWEERVTSKLIIANKEIDSGRRFLWSPVYLEGFCHLGSFLLRSERRDLGALASVVFVLRLEFSYDMFLSGASLVFSSHTFVLMPREFLFYSIDDHFTPLADCLTFSEWTNSGTLLISANLRESFFHWQWELWAVYWDWVGFLLCSITFTSAQIPFSPRWEPQVLYLVREMGSSTRPASWLTSKAFFMLSLVSSRRNTFQSMKDALATVTLLKSLNGRLHFNASIVASVADIHETGPPHL
jgi:hypothetical protein